jgi:tetratricopeptide (TPR) repeat protein
MCCRVPRVLVVGLLVWVSLATRVWAQDEAHAERASLERELAAVEAVHTNDPRFVEAVHRAGWICFLLDRPSEAITRFARVLDLAPPESAIRDEALQMLGALFADRDWDRDGRLDEASAQDRLEDGALVSSDRPWFAALYFETARALHLTSRDPEAIALIDHALSRWPPPPNGTVLEAACRRHRARLQAMEQLRGTLPAADAICARRAPP